MEQILINVCNFPPPEPMQKILLALSTLPADYFLKVIHRRKPIPLFEKLSAASYFFQCYQLSDELFHIFIYRKSDKKAFEIHSKRTLDFPLAFEYAQDSGVEVVDITTNCEEITFAEQANVYLKINTKS